MQLSKYEEVLFDRHILQERRKLDDTIARAEPQDLAIIKARCGRANVLRRQCFSSWQNRYEQGNETFDASFDPVEEPNAMAEDLIKLPQQSVQQISLQPSALAQSAQRTVTTFDSSKIIPHVSSYYYSRATRTVPSQGLGGKMPPWPSIDGLPSTEYFQCPYCFLICHETHRKSNDDWRSAQRSSPFRIIVIC